MKKESETMQRYRNILAKDFPENEKDRAYYIKKAAVVVELSGGELAIVEKENIKTSFWFGEGMYTPMEEALESCYSAKSNENYFMYENMMNLNSLLESVKNNDLLLIACPCYKSTVRINISFSGAYEWENEKWRFNPGSYILSDKDRAAYRKGIEEAIKIREKRLNTYLKKYGLSHVTANTYWEDR